MYFNKKKQIAVLTSLFLIFSVWFFWEQNKTQDETVESIVSTGHRVIGTSVEGRAIDAYTYGSGDTHLLFVGGIHGGYEWNSVLLAYAFMDHMERYPESIHDDLKITVIPSANPDGVFEVVSKEGRFNATDVKTEFSSGTGRFNANGVDLNRNFDCKWEPESTWKGIAVSGGRSPFSEPESLAIREFVSASAPSAVVFWHSQSNAVYGSECKEGILQETKAVMNAYSRASGYPAIESFDHYPITGDAEGWLASIGIPAITVELADHESIEWEKNLEGIKALFSYYSLKD